MFGYKPTYSPIYFYVSDFVEDFISSTQYIIDDYSISKPLVIFTEELASKIMVGNSFFLAPIFY
jgi:hypothetical protein